MKKISAFLLSLVLASLTYAQAVEMTTILPVNSSIVVDELRTFATDQSNLIKNDMFIGAVAPNNLSEEPFQTQTLRVGGKTSITESIYAGRDLFINANLSFTLTDIKNGNLFTSQSYFQEIEADTFRAKKIQWVPDSKPTEGTYINFNINNLSGRDIKVSSNSVIIERPFNKGTVIVKNNISKLAEEKTTDADKNNQHIFLPWGNLSKNSINNTCLANESAYGACATNTSCTDVRTKQLPAVYNANGAIFEKFATAKFYCKPKDVYDETTGALTSSCEHYMIYSDLNGNLIEGFTATTAENGDITNPLDGANTPNTINLEDDTAQKCAAACSSGSGGCSVGAAGDYYYAFNMINTTLEEETEGETSTYDPSMVLVNFSDEFNASCGTTDASAWPAGSGLSCKAQEKVIDIYVLRCYTGSGSLLREADTYYQSRTVLCRKYDQIYGTDDTNNTGEKAAVSNIENKAFFSADFISSGDTGI